MSRARAAFAMATLAVALLPPGVALAWHGGRSHEGGTRPPAVAPPPRASRPHPAAPRPPFPFFRFAAPIVQNPPPVVYVQPPPVVYVVTRPDAAPEPGPIDLTPPTPPVAPAPEVVLATGRWELHGDGLTWPHVWVWVPAYRPREAAPSPPPPPPGE